MRVELYTDGAAMNNGGPGMIAYAVVALLPKGIVQEQVEREWRERASSVEAELLAIRLGLGVVPAERRPNVELLAFSDHEWSVRALKGEYQIDTHVDLVREIRAVLRLFRSAEVNWIRGHCGHRHNERAHTLANRAVRGEEGKGSVWPAGAKTCLDQAPPPPPLILPSDYDILPPPSPATPTASASGDSKNWPLEQARLNAAAQPKWSWNAQNCRWTGRYQSETEWPTETLRDRLAQIQQDIQALEPLVARPPQEWTDAHWTEMHDRLWGWKGHAHALEWTLNDRERRAKRRTQTTPSPPRATLLASPSYAPTPSPALSMASGRDPFENE